MLDSRQFNVFSFFWQANLLMMEMRNRQAPLAKLYACGSPGGTHCDHDSFAEAPAWRRTRRLVRCSVAISYTILLATALLLAPASCIGTENAASKKGATKGENAGRWFGGLFGGRAHEEQEAQKAGGRL